MLPQSVRSLLFIAAFALVGSEAGAQQTPPASRDRAASPGAASPLAAAPAEVEAVPPPRRRATPAERLAADRLDPVARAVFWQREYDSDPSDVGAGVGLARALRAMGRYDEADAAAAKVLVIAPDNVEALLEQSRSRIAVHQGFYTLPSLKRAAELAPRDWRPWSLLGVAYGQAERLQDSRKAYLQALKLSPDNPAVLSNLGLSYAETGETETAEAYLRKAVQQKAATAQERQNLALFLGLRGRRDEAEALIREDLPPEVADQNIAYLKALGETRRAQTQTPALAPAPAPASGGAQAVPPKPL